MGWKKDWLDCTKEQKLVDGIKYRYHKHWGMNCWAGEGLTIKDGDRSGCLHEEESRFYGCSKPSVVFQRIYYKGEKQISAVLSYPHGIGAVKRYFWEIYPSSNGDVERFFDEEEMEKAIIKIFKGRKYR